MLSGATLPSGQALQLRAAIIGSRLAVAGAARCAKQGPVTGLLLHDLAAYDRKTRPIIARQYALSTGIGVIGVVPGSAAQQAGLKAGDEITALGEVPITKLDLPPEREEASYDRVEAFTGHLDSTLANGPARLTVRNSGRERSAFLAQRMGCAARIAVLPGDKPEAWSDGRYAAVSEALAHDAGDDELAFALAHEMAHVVLGHAQAKRPAFASIGIAGGRTRAREREADRLGTLIMTDAGFGPEGAETFLRRMGAAHGRLSLTHPSLASRIAATRAAAAQAQTSTDR